jgi:hypothetical protein
MPDPRETEQGGFGAFAEIDRERRAARELAAWDAAFAAACPAGHAESPAPVADPDGAPAEALTAPGAVHHIEWGNDWLSVTAHCGWRELNEAEPRRIEETDAEGKRGQG